MTLIFFPQKKSHFLLRKVTRLKCICNFEFSSLWWKSPAGTFDRILQMHFVTERSLLLDSCYWWFDEKGEGEEVLDDDANGCRPADDSPSSHFIPLLLFYDLYSVLRYFRDEIQENEREDHLYPELLAILLVSPSGQSKINSASASVFSVLSPLLVPVQVNPFSFRQRVYK